MIRKSKKWLSLYSGDTDICNKILININKHKHILFIYLILDGSKRWAIIGKGRYRFLFKKIENIFCIFFSPLSAKDTNISYVILIIPRCINTIYSFVFFKCRTLFMNRIFFIFFVGCMDFIGLSCVVSLINLEKKT